MNNITNKRMCYISDYTWVPRFMTVSPCRILAKGPCHCVDFYPIHSTLFLCVRRFLKGPCRPCRFLKVPCRRVDHVDFYPCIVTRMAISVELCFLCILIFGTQTWGLYLWLPQDVSFLSVFLNSLYHNYYIIYRCICVGKYGKTWPGKTVHFWGLCEWQKPVWGLFYSLSKLLLIGWY